MHDLRLLTVLREVALRGSFSAAAESLAYTQRAVAAFRRLRPAIEVDISLLGPHESIPALRRGDIEIAITEEGGFAGETDTSGLEREHLLDDHMWVSLPADHPL